MSIKMLGAVALGLVSMLSGASDVKAGLFGRNSCAPVCCPPVCCPPVCCTPVCCPPVCCIPVCIETVHVAPPSHTPPPHKPEEPGRQVRVTYFNTKYSAWFETDAIVSPKNAAIGLSVDVNVPGVGHVRGWIVTVYTQPRLQSPYGTQTQEAVKAPSSLSLKAETTVQALVSKPIESSRLSGCTRLWTNKAGDKHVVGELIKADSTTITIRTADGRVVDQPIANLSDADVKFIGPTEESLPMAVEVN